MKKAAPKDGPMYLRFAPQWLDIAARRRVSR